jgi:hypothetical protein
MRAGSQLPSLVARPPQIVEAAAEVPNVGIGGRGRIRMVYVGRRRRRRSKGPTNVY